MGWGRGRKLITCLPPFDIVQMDLPKETVTVKPPGIYTVYITSKVVVGESSGGGVLWSGKVKSITGLS